MLFTFFRSFWAEDTQVCLLDRKVALLFDPLHMTFSVKHQVLDLRNHILYFVFQSLDFRNCLCKIILFLFEMARAYEMRLCWYNTHTAALLWIQSTVVLEIQKLLCHIIHLWTKVGPRGSMEIKSSLMFFRVLKKRTRLTASIKYSAYFYPCYFFSPMFLRVKPQHTTHSLYTLWLMPNKHAHFWARQRGGGRTETQKKI